MRAVQLTHFRLLATRFSECFRFYRDVLGLETKFPDDGGPYAEFILGDDKFLALFDGALMAEAIGTSSLPPGSDGRDRFVLVIHVDDVDKVEANLAAAGVDIIAGATDRPDWGLRTVHTRDPDGNLIELWSPPAGGDQS